jgi:hypothetical protein
MLNSWRQALLNAHLATTTTKNLSWKHVTVSQIPQHRLNSYRRDKSVMCCSFLWSIWKRSSIRSNLWFASRIMSCSSYETRLSNFKNSLKMCPKDHRESRDRFHRPKDNKSRQWRVDKTRVLLILRPLSPASTEILVKYFYDIFLAPFLAHFFRIGPLNCTYIY